jgi:hypothetical protein
MRRSTRTPSALHPTWAWILGLAAGFIGTWIAALVPIVGVPILALVALALVLRGPKAAVGGAMLLATGLWFAFFEYQQLANCDAINATNGVCQMGDTTSNTAIVFAFVFAGAALSVYALFLGKRSLRGGE